MKSVAVLADEPAMDTLCAWLTDAGHDVHACTMSQAVRAHAATATDMENTVPEWQAEAEAFAALIAQLPDCDTLITSGGRLATSTAVSSELLQALPPNALWLQLGVIPETMAVHLAERACRAQVAFLHAPLLPPLRDRDVRPPCVAFADQDDAGLARARVLLESLTPTVHWMGWLGSPGPARLVNEASTVSRTAASARALAGW